jgi:hypothetical protein
MRRPRDLLSLILLALPLAAAGCPTEPQRPPREAMPPEDEWSRIPPSKDWLFATGDFSGPHKAECDHVLGWVRGEDGCKASLCEHGKDLSAEWLTRCSSLEDPSLTETVRRLQAELASRAGEAETDCAKRFDDMVRDGCGQAAACLVSGQRWATRCAKSDGTPLTLRILQRTIERKQEQGADPIQLDTRTCDELRADMMEAGKCKDRFACGEAIGRVETYHDRCEGDERPTIATAVVELTVQSFGGKPPGPILVRQGSPAVDAAELPVALGDGSGGVITVCEERASELGRYVESRRGCQNGKMVVARAFQTPSGVEVRLGALDFPDDAVFSARYPTIVAAGEVELRDKAAAAALDAGLDKAAALAKDTPGAAEAARLVAQVMLANVLSIKRSPAVRNAIARRDAELGPALRELAKAKVAALAQGRKVSPSDAAGLLARARTRAFADLGPDGTVQIGAASRALTLDTTVLLPKAMEAYLGVLKGSRPRRVDPRTQKAELARGTAAAQACGAAEKKLQETKKALVSCNFGLESCDQGRHAELLKAVDEARVAAEAAFRDVETTRTGGAAEDEGSITRAAETAGCREPWW